MSYIPLHLFNGLRTALLILAFVVVFGPSAQAGPRDDTFYWGSGADFSDISPYFDHRPEAEIFSRLIWDRLFYRDPQSANFKPHLATKLKWIGITTVEIDLRRDVRFHNGDGFSADDILETVKRMKDPRFGQPRHRGIEWIKKVEKLSAYKIRIDLKRPTPQIMELLAGPLVILPKAAWRSVPLDADGKPDYKRMAPIGSGPYRVTGIKPGLGGELEINRRYAPGPKGRPRIGKIFYAVVSDSEERLAQLLDGRLDWIWKLSKDAMTRLVETGAPVQLARSPSIRVAFLMLDRTGRNDSETPFRDVRVRRAIAHSINRAEISQNVFGPPSKTLHSLCHPIQFGCSDDVARYKYDPEKARKLLKSAGYGPAGEFRLVDRLSNLAHQLPGQTPEKVRLRLKTINADILSYRNHRASKDISLYLQAIGIDSEVDEYSDFESARRAIRGGNADIIHMTWASHGALDVSEILNPLFRNSAFDYCRDSEVNRWLDVAANSNEPKTRKRAFSNALRRLQELACVVPLFNYATFYAYSKRVAFAPSVDDIPRLYRLKWQ